MHIHPITLQQTIVAAAAVAAPQQARQVQQVRGAGASSARPTAQTEQAPAETEDAKPAATAQFSAEALQLAQATADDDGEQ